MEQTKYKKSLIFVAVLVLIAVALFLYSVFFTGPNTINPATESLDDNPNAGITYALIYNQGELYENINFNDEALRLIQEDLALFAKSTESQFLNTDTLVGFTFDDGYEQNENTYIHTGYFYSLDEKIELEVTPYEDGFVTLSITNLDTGANIDNQLNLNGLKNRLLTTLPIEESNYSIRYLKSKDEIVVSFYLGYSMQDVDAVEVILNEAYGGTYDTGDIIFNINAVGNATLAQAREFVNDPRNIPTFNR